jgi:predicted ArsR family transcriptional regulator
MNREGPFGPGLGETQRLLLLALKRLGTSTVAELRAELGLAPATLREHLQALELHRLVERRGSRRHERGRPEVLYGVAPGGEALFPHAEAAVLRELVAFLEQDGQRATLERFFSERLAQRRADGLERVAGLAKAERLAEVARLFSEEGFMAEPATAADGTPALRMRHCPLRDVVAATDLPCRAEIALAQELAGQPLIRIEHSAHKRGACTYGLPSRTV